MKIGIIGAGAMGCLYGAKLSEHPENDVFLVDVWKEHVDLIQSSGLEMEENGRIRQYRKVRASCSAEQIGCCDLVIVFVKSTLTRQAVRENRSLFGTDTIALTLQNGLGNIDILCEEIGASHVIAGTTAHGATMLGPGKMRHAGCGTTIIGELDGSCTKRLETIACIFRNADLETELSDNVLGLVWDKLMVNVGINALTGITGLQNGNLLDYPEIEELLEAAVREAQSVAQSKGIKLNFQDPAGHTKDVCRATANNRSSMLQDILNGKQTEIDMINGAIVREGAAEGIDTPVNHVLTNLIRFTQRQK